MRNQFRYAIRSATTKKHIKEAKAVGLTLLGEGRNKYYRTYCFNQCGHEQEIVTSHVRIKNFRCAQCLQDRRNEEAKAVGLTLLGEGRSYRSRTYRFNECGHEQEIDTGAVRSNYFTCNTCKETARDLPSKVYLLRITVDTVIPSVTWLKLGYAKSVSSRIKYYGLPRDAGIKKLKVIDFATGRHARRFEASLHTKYKHKRLLMKKMKEFMANGFNECYPVEMFNTLMKDIIKQQRSLNECKESKTTS
jgi:hypothetical protein